MPTKQSGALSNSITFQLQGDAAVITRRAATRLNLTVTELPDGGFRVELRTPLDAYRLGDLTATDPGWARLFLER